VLVARGSSDLDWQEGSCLEMVDYAHTSYLCHCRDWKAPCTGLGLTETSFCELLSLVRSGSR